MPEGKGSQNDASARFGSTETWNRWESEFSSDDGSDGGAAIAPPHDSLSFERGVSGARRIDYVHLLAKQLAKSQEDSTPAPVAIADFIKSELRSMASSGRSRAEFLRDVAYISDCLANFMRPELAKNWLTSFNAQLVSRPLDAIAVGSIGRVIDAIEIQRDSAY